jgi:hypothetical protein
MSDGENAIKGGSHKRYTNGYPRETFASVQRGRYNSVVSPTGEPEAFNDASVLQTQIELGRRRVPLRDPSADPQQIANLYGIERIEPRSYWSNKGGPAGRASEYDPAVPNSDDTGHFFEALPDCTLGFLNEPFRDTNPSSTKDPKREPVQPFPWLTWNNRPFANAGELLQVPAFNGLDLIQAFSYASAATTKIEHYNKSDDVVDLLEDLKTKNPKLTEVLEVDGRFGHLLNFFRKQQHDPSNDSDPSNPTTLTDDQGIAGLYRLLDYVQVPSPFVGTETWLNPASFGGVNVTSTNDPRYGLQPPFNQVKSYREPGRVNINTVASADVWDGGLLHRTKTGTSYDSNSGHAGPSAQQLSASRRGYGALTSSGLLLDPDVPTFFENPFRATDAVDLVPTLGMLLNRASPPTVRQSVQGSLLRQDEFSTAVNQPPLMAGDRSGVANAPVETDRNPYFRYQPISRLSSMTTTRSNVYAVWVTIGFFEVEEAPDWSDPTVQTRFNNSRPLYDRVYPDGFQFGQEAGSDTGDIRRVREFALVDRTVPVAFEPGENHNVDKAVRLRRRIE